MNEQIQDRIAQQFAGNIFSQGAEKSYIDKITAKQDIEDLRLLIRRSGWTRQELLEVLYRLTSAESKLYNLSEWDRYIVLKFFVWIRDFCKAAELLYDYKDDLEKKEKAGITPLSPRTIQLLYNCERHGEHDTKFLIDLYLNICRTSLSVGATGFLEILNNRFEITYPQAGIAAQQPEQKTKWWQVKK